jgi:hypothetical protein
MNNADCAVPTHDEQKEANGCGCCGDEDHEFVASGAVDDGAGYDATKRVSDDGRDKMCSGNRVGYVGCDLKV